MGRVKEEIRVNGQRFWTLFDSGSRNTYITPEVASHFAKVKLDKVRAVDLGGRTHRLKNIVILKAKVEDKPVEINAYVIDRVGLDEKGREIHILLGALAMQQWGIELNLKKEQLDLTHYPKEFIEFCG